MANTSALSVEDRKAAKRKARKAAAPKAPRTGARGENKAKVKKASRGQSQALANRRGRRPPPPQSYPATPLAGKF